MIFGILIVVKTFPFFVILVVTQASAQQVIDDSAAKVGVEKSDAAIASVMSRLKDPLSAQFSSFTHPNPMYSQYPKNMVCGMVNAKNGYGGYVGFSPFAYDVLTKTTIILSSEMLASASGELSVTAFKFSACASALGLSL
jgi:hypothetical protein